MLPDFNLTKQSYVPSQTTQLHFTSMCLLSADDVNKIVIKAFGCNYAVVSYSFEPFSAIKVGTFGSYRLLKVNVKNVSNSVGDGGLKTSSFFVKSRPESDVIRGLMEDTTFAEEINFYKNIKPLMLSNHVSERWSPECYLAKDNALVIEDLRAQGFFMNPGGTLDERLLKSALGSLARFHASTLVAESKLGQSLNKAFPNFFSEQIFDDTKKFGKSTLLGFKTMVSVAEKLGLDASFVLPHLYDYVYKAVRPREGELNVLCHSDLWNNNFLFNKNVVSECVIVDYQVLRYASPVADLSMLLNLNSTTEYRKKMEYEMVQYYYSIFQETLDRNNIKIKNAIYESLLNTYRKYRIIGMVMKMISYPLVCIDYEHMKKIIYDPKAVERYMLHDRMEIIEPYLDTSPAFVKRMKDLLCEILNEGKLVLNF